MKKNERRRRQENQFNSAKSRLESLFKTQLNKFSTSISWFMILLSKLQLQFNLKNLSFNWKLKILNENIDLREYKDGK